ncbi:MAG: 3-hydroxyacyl-CoA dehydrogenase NAD-binding domain-containing protein [Chthoniobacterales bacterium]
MNVILKPEGKVIPSSALHVSEPVENVITVTFDRPESSVNIFDSPTLLELEKVILSLENHEGLKGVIFQSAKPSVFIAGADLKEIRSAQNRRELVERGQRIFAKIAALRCVTVAAIHGACAGGGYELTLACDYRVASRSKETMIGLPEVQLGIIPAWGGSTRLPRLIGLSRALGIILAGTLFPPEKAFKLKMVDALTSRERMGELALKYVSRGKRKSGFSIFEMAIAPIVARIARKRVIQKTRGNYPAPLKAIEVVCKGIGKSIDESLILEQDAIVELADTETCQNLIRIFFLREKVRHQKVSDTLPITNAAVVGAGVMGAGIAQWFSSKNLHVILRDVAADPLGKGLMHIAKLYQQAVKRRLMSRTEAQAGMDRIFPSENECPLSSVDIIMEAAVEKMALKKELFQRLEKVSSPDALLATNTSALSISEIAEGLKYPERMVGIHFFNPVHRMKLVEVVRGKNSSEEAVSRATAFALRVGKLPVVVNDRPGFLVNRILMPYLMEAAILFEQGVSAKEIDDAMLDFGMPMGPLRLLDEVGLDVAADVAQTLCEAFPDRFQMPQLLEKMLKIGWKGKKSGTGFYHHSKGGAKVNQETTRYQTNAFSVLSREELQQRMVLLMINEAARCLEEEVVSDRGDVDFAMIFGTGFAPFRGGPLRYADSLGTERIITYLKNFELNGGARYHACTLLQEMYQSGKKFYDDKNTYIH